MHIRKRERVCEDGLNTMKRKTITLLFLGGLLLVVFDICICRRMYYIPQAGLYVRQVPIDNDVVDNYFSRRILPLFFKRYKSLDVVRMNHLSEMGCKMMLDRNNGVLYLLELSGSGDYDNFISFSDNSLKIEVVYCESDSMFHSGHNLIDPYTLIWNSRRFGLCFYVAPARKVHLYYLFKPLV